MRTEYAIVICCLIEVPSGIGDCPDDLRMALAFRDLHSRLFRCIGFIELDVLFIFEEDWYKI